MCAVRGHHSYHFQYCMENQILCCVTENTLFVHTIKIHLVKCTNRFEVFDIQCVAKILWNADYNWPTKECPFLWLIDQWTRITINRSGWCDLCYIVTEIIIRHYLHLALYFQHTHPTFFSLAAQMPYFSNLHFKCKCAHTAKQ